VGFAEALGRPIVEVFQVISETTRQPIDSPITRCLREGRTVDMVEPSLLVNRRGQEISMQDSAAPIRDRRPPDRRRHGVPRREPGTPAAARAVLPGDHDALTGLINRREFEHRLNEILQSSRADPDVRHVVLYLDLDQFKVVNDTCGHQAGDRLLKQITSVLQTRIRTSDTLARLGGDEFGVLLLDCNLDMRNASPRTCARRSATSASSGTTHHECRRFDRPHRNER
jgi:diguanylate cyclase (GGDEF)-like protein